MSEEVELDELGKPKKKPVPVKKDKPVETEGDRENSAKSTTFWTAISMLAVPATMAILGSGGVIGTKTLAWISLHISAHFATFLTSFLGIQSSLTASGALFFGGLLGGPVFGVLALVVLPLVLLALYNLYKGNALDVTKDALATLLFAAVVAAAVGAVCFFWLIPTFFPVAAALLLPISLGIAVIPMLAVLYWKRENIIALWKSVSAEPIKTAEKAIGIAVIVVGILALTGIIALPAAFIFSPAIIIFIGLSLFAGVPSLLVNIPIEMKKSLQSMKERFSPSDTQNADKAVPVPANAPTKEAAPAATTAPAATSPSSPHAAVAAAAAANQPTAAAVPTNS